MANLLYRVTTTPPTPTSTSVSFDALTSTQIDGNFKSLNDELITKAPLTGEGVSGTWSINISGNAGTVTNGVVTTESYSNPAWITSLTETKVLPSQTNNSGKFLTTNGTSSSWVTIDAFPTQTNNAGKFLTTNGTAVSWATVDALPSQTNNSGKFLTTNGTAVSWATVDALPSQTNNAGKFLTTNGTAVSWVTIDAFPSQTNNSGKFLTTNGTAVSWATVDALPSQTNNSGKFLTTNGTSASWSAITDTTNAANITSGTLPNARLVSIPNSSLANSNITIGTTSISLGTSSNVLAGLTSIAATTFTGSLTGNASSASTLQTGRTISITGDINWTSPSFNGSSNITAAATLANSGVTAGNYNNVTVNSKGIVTAASTVNYLTLESDTLQTVTSRGASSNVSTIFLSAQTSSTSSATGALVVSGGVGVGGTINVAGDAIISGSLIVNGTTTTINSNTVAVDDKNIELGSVVAISSVSGIISSTAVTTTITGITSTVGMIPGQALARVSGAGAFGGATTIVSVDSATQITITSTTANTVGTIIFSVGGATNVTAAGGGITLKGDSDKTIIWGSTNGWTSSETFNIASGKTYKINGTDVLSSTTLGSGVTGSSLTSVGTINTGTWQGSGIGLAYGGTGASLSAAAGGIVYSTSSAMAITPAGTSGQVLTSSGSSAPTWKTITTTIPVSDDTSTNATYYPSFIQNTSGELTSTNVSSTKLYFNPSTGTLSSTNFNSLSDITKKENIKTIVNALNKTIALRGVTYDWIDNKRHSLGLIAQEVEHVVPEVVETSHNGIKTIAYQNLIGLLIEAIKDQQKIIDQQEKRLVALENK